jgi:DNA-binding transcriptional regulator YdaS (Cro superfamily)
LVAGQRELARRLTEEVGKPISQAHVWGWLNEVNKFPPEMCAPIERITDGHVRRDDLRPDLFGRDQVA